MLNDEQGLAMPARRVTLSTVGLVPMMDRLAQESIDAQPGGLAARRDRGAAGALVPLEEVGLEAIIDACRRFPLSKRERITFEYVLLAGVNDSVDDARRLVKVLAGVQGQGQPDSAESAPGIPFERPSDERVDLFAKMLADAA